MTREKYIATHEDSIPELAARCSTIANRSARIGISLDKLNSGGYSHATLQQTKSLGSTVGDFVLETDTLATQLEQTAGLPEPCRRHLEVLVADAEELASITSAVLSHGGRGRQLDSAAQEKLVQTHETWKMMLQLVTSFQSLIQSSDETNTTRALEMTTNDFDELERLINRLQVTEPVRQDISAAGPSANREGLPDYSETVPSTGSPQFPGDNKQALSQAQEENTTPPSASPSTDRPKLGTFGGFFRSITTKLGSPIPPLVAPLCQAAAAGNIDHVRGLIKEGASINVHNEEGYTPLTAAIHGEGHDNHLETVRFLLGSGAKVTTKDAIWSLPPLWHAARAGRLDVINLLIDCGADPRATTTSGSSYFYDSIEKVSVPVLELLLKRGANPNAASLSGKKGVVGCVQRSDIAKVRVLLEAGAKVTGTTPAGHSALAVAVTNKDVAMAEFLISYGAKPQSSDAHGRSLVSLAVGNEDVDMLRMLLARRAPADGKDLYGNTALANAVQKDDPTMTEMLLRCGADASATDHTGVPILAIAVTQNHLAQARMLVQHRADVDISTSRSMSSHLLVSALQIKAPEEQQLDFVRLLLQHRSNPNVTPGGYEGGGTAALPLGYCIKKGKHEALRVLLEGGADPHRSGQDGTRGLSNPLSKDTPFRYAATTGKAESLRVMLECGAISKLSDSVASVERILFETAEASHDDKIITMLLDEGLDQVEGSTKRAMELSENEDLRRIVAMRPHSMPSRTEPGPPLDDRDAPPAYNEVGA